MADDDIRVSLEKEALEAYKEEYKDLLVAFQGMDSKAQGVVAIAGVFVGGIFAFLNAANFTRSSMAVSLLVFAILFLASSVLLAVLVLRVRDTMGVPTGEHTAQILEDLLALEDTVIKSVLSRFYGDKTRAWQNCVNRVRSDVEKKSDFVWASQLMLFIGIICVALMAVLKLF